jgi:hypothetical protein
MDQIEGIEEGGRHWDGPVEAGAALLLACKGEDRRLEVDPIGGEGQGLRGPTAGIQQRLAIGADLTGGGLCGLAEGGTLGAREIEAVALPVIHLHASGGGHEVPFCRRRRILRKTSI